MNTRSTELEEKKEDTKFIHFLKLPAVLQTNVIQHLNLSDAAKMSQISKKINHFVKTNSTFWKIPLNRHYSIKETTLNPHKVLKRKFSVETEDTRGEIKKRHLKLLRFLKENKKEQFAEVWNETKDINDKIRELFNISDEQGDCFDIAFKNHYSDFIELFYSTIVSQFEDKEKKIDYTRLGPWKTHFLYWAATFGKDDVVEKLIKEKIDINIVCTGNETALYSACSYGRLSTVKLLLAAKADVNIVTDHKRSPLDQAALNGDLTLVELLIKHRANIQNVNKYGSISIHHAAVGGNTSIIKLLIALGADPDLSRRSDGTSPLILAAQVGNLSAVKLFIKHGAKVKHVCTDDGCSALHLSAQNGHMAISELLINQGANVNQRCTNDNCTPLYLTAEQGETETAELLLKNHADVDTAFNLGTTPLMIAAKHNHIEMIELLLRYRANTELHDIANKTALDFTKSEEAMQIILSAQKKTSENTEVAEPAVKKMRI